MRNARGTRSQSRTASNNNRNTVNNGDGEPTSRDQQDTATQEPGSSSGRPSGQSLEALIERAVEQRLQQMLNDRNLNPRPQDERSETRQQTPRTSLGSGEEGFDEEQTEQAPRVVPIVQKQEIAPRNLSTFHGRAVSEWQQWTQAAEDAFRLSPAYFTNDESKV